MSVVNGCYRKAVGVLKGNSTEFGFKASRERYNSLWGRDGSITYLGATLISDDELIDANLTTAATLIPGLTLYHRFFRREWR